ncbi:hypothetical protein HID58_085724 [Brassica napus]|uniref:Uncharacterized protein n=1 Tax=Brassica napus TaxID=3708 RepID=A0ABQ7XNL5_BRANA|nr:hypothetical protein HID58_085724 [Brassica napus]
MPHLLLRDRSAPLRLLRLYSSSSLSLSTSVLLFPGISAPCLSTIMRSIIIKNNRNCDASSPPLHLSYVKLLSTVMPHLLLRDRSAPLRLLRLYSSSSLSLSTSVLLFPGISAPCLSTIMRSIIIKNNRNCDASSPPLHLSYVKLLSTVMPHLLLRDRSAPLRLLRLYSSSSLSLSTSVILFPGISAPCLSTIMRYLLMSLHLHCHLYQLMFEQSKGEDEAEDRYGVEEQR